LSSPQAEAAARRSGVIDALGMGRVFLAVHEAIAALAPAAHTSAPMRGDKPG
jgi:hypothetical protein